MARTQGHVSQGARTIILLLACLAFFSAPLFARDVFVMLSGGDTPFDNNYSQYLQAKTITAFFQQNYPSNSVWTFFGAGNVEGQQPVFGDVHRQRNRDGLLLDSWIPGSLPRNLPARHDLILRTFRDEILPAVANGGTLYLFVGDHGSRTHGKNPESIIALWSLSPDGASEHGWRYSRDESLSVTEFRRTLAGGIGRGRIVFCMTQCHSGGFHYLAFPRTPTPNPKWFTVMPDYAAPKNQPAFPAVAGFTATDEMSPAAGCDPDPDPDKWAGYERFVPENLLGINLFNSKPTTKALHSFSDAHIAATLVDNTIDKPYSTSEQYLERWANLIETRLAKEPNLTTKVRKQVAAYQRALDGATPKISDPAFRERQAQFNRFINRMTEQNFGLRTLLVAGTRKELEAAIDPANVDKQTPNRRRPQSAPQARQTPSKRRGGGGAPAERRKLYTDTIRPAWKQAVESNRITNLPPAALEFEKYLLSREDQGSNYFSFRGAAALQDEVFWNSGYSDPQTLNPAKAEAIVRWGAERRSQIVIWAFTSTDTNIQAAATKLMNSMPELAHASTLSPDLSTPLLSEDIAAARTLFYRRVLAAWQFLLAVNERPALAKIHELTELERTPLPQPQAQHR
ncbi:hypothetical protein [Pedosphaera parvula]|nr:hypothetical protein [Pedosphaera parvula]